MMPTGARHHRRPEANVVPINPSLPPDQNSGTEAASQPLEPVSSDGYASRAGLVLGALLFLAVGIVVYRELEAVTWSQVRESIDAIGWADVAFAALATAVSYIALIGYDVLALRQIGSGSIPLRVVSFTSFVAHALTFSLGFGAL